MPLTITVDDKAGFLAKTGSALMIFRGAGTINALARPVVWGCIPPPFLAKTTVTWTDAVAAFISTTPVSPGNRIAIGDSKTIVPGRTLRIGASGATEVTAGASGSIRFFNDASQLFTCGLLQAVNDQPPAPFCALPVPGKSEQGLTLSGALLLFFSSARLEPGTIVGDSIIPKVLVDNLVEGGRGSELATQTQGVLVTDTSVPRELAYSTVTGSWSWGGGTWAEVVQADDPIVPRLIRSS
jgi:hypothetical protein